MSEFNDNRQPRRRRTQLNAAQYAGQQTLDNSIPLIRTEDAPMQPTNPPRRNPQPAPAQQTPIRPCSDERGSADGCGPSRWVRLSRCARRG